MAVQLLASSLFQRQQVAKGVTIPVATRLKGCPTLQKIPSIGELWAKVEHLQAPGPDELTHFSLVAGAAAKQQACSPAELQEMGREARTIIDQHLLECGSILLQGLPISQPEACEAFVEGMGFTRQRYEPYGSPSTRQKVRSLDAATNVSPPELLDLHNEMCYNPRPNKKIMLICLHPAEEGGESLLGDSAAMAAVMPEFVLQRFADHGGGLKYTRVYVSAEAQQVIDSPDGSPPLTWQERTGFKEPEAAAGFFKDLGFAVEWKDGDTLVATHVAPAVVPHPVTGMPVWFNLSHFAMPGFIEYADGSPIEPDTVNAITAVRLSATRALMLDAGDVLVCDNYRCAHGRLPYEGTGRSLVAVLTSD